MTDQQHPITPPPKLFAQWENDILNSQDNVDYVLDCAWRNGFQAGADQELEACCEWVSENVYCNHPFSSHDLRAARRPQPPSLKEQALQAAQRFYANGHEDCNDEEVKDDFDIIRRALEQLND